MLTKEEIEVAADAARRYPIGYGVSFFAHRMIGSPRRVLMALADNPSLLKDG